MNTQFTYTFFLCTLIALGSFDAGISLLALAGIAGRFGDFFGVILGFSSALSCFSAASTCLSPSSSACSAESSLPTTYKVYHHTRSAVQYHMSYIRLGLDNATEILLPFKVLPLNIVTAFFASSSRARGPSRKVRAISNSWHESPRNTMLSFGSIKTRSTCRALWRTTRRAWRWRGAARYSIFHHA